MIVTEPTPKRTTAYLNQSKIQQHILSTMFLRNNEAPLSSLEDAITCQRIIEACEKSVEEGIHVNIN